MSPFKMGVALALLTPVAVAISCVVAVGGPVHDVEGVGYQEDLIYGEAPPAPRTEIIVGSAPSSEHLWVGGYWTRYNGSWSWVEGRWAARPTATAVWEPGHWDHRPHGYVWVAGRWR